VKASAQTATNVNPRELTLAMADALSDILRDETR
jgi:hypothetical protein